MHLVYSKIALATLRHFFHPCVWLILSQSTHAQNLLKCHLRAGSITPWLKALAPLIEDQNMVPCPNTQRLATVYDSSSKDSNMSGVCTYPHLDTHC